MKQLLVNKTKQNKTKQNKTKQNKDAFMSILGHEKSVLRKWIVKATQTFWFLYSYKCTTSLPFCQVQFDIRRDPLWMVTIWFYLIFITEQGENSLTLNSKTKENLSSIHKKISGLWKRCFQVEFTKLPYYFSCTIWVYSPVAKSTFRFEKQLYIFVMIGFSSIHCTTPVFSC
jgi:hypothetical protein